MRSGTYLHEACLQFSLNRFYHFLFFLRGLISCNRHVPVQNRFPAPHRNLQPSTRWRCIQRRLQCLFQKYWSQAPDYLWNIPCFCEIQFPRWIVRHGKGDKDRHVMIPRTLICELRRGRQMAFRWITYAACRKTGHCSKLRSR